MKVFGFIDGSNLYASVKMLGFDVDYKRLWEELNTWGELVRVNYYTAVKPNTEESPLRPLVDWLDYNKYSLVTKLVKEFPREDGTYRIKGNMDLEMACDILEMAGKVDMIVLFTGDADFTCVVNRVRRTATKVVVVSTINMIGDELRRAADEYRDLVDLRSRIEKLRRREVEGTTSVRKITLLRKARS